MERAILAGCGVMGSGRLRAVAKPMPANRVEAVVEAKSLAMMFGVIGRPKSRQRFAIPG